jgi:hypothetical protein
MMTGVRFPPCPPIYMEEKLEAEGFISDDGKHTVEWLLWTEPPDFAYFAWICITHDRLYYVDCINDAQSE